LVKAPILDSNGSEGRGDATLQEHPQQCGATGSKSEALVLHVESSIGAAEHLILFLVDRLSHFGFEIVT
jgi:hypothetical protein